MRGAGQNLSSAVMAQRIEPHDSLDFFPTPPWAARAFCEMLAAKGRNLGLFTARDPACGTGDLVLGLRDYFRVVEMADIHDHRLSAHWHNLPAAGVPLCDFTMPAAWPEDLGAIDWIVTNPPFRRAEDFIHTGLAHARRGVAILVRTAFLEAEGRFETLFSQRRPAFVWQFVERVVMAKGALRDPDRFYMRKINQEGDFDERVRAKPSTATAYCWIVWLVGDAPVNTQFDWIAPCRRRLTRPFDYPRLAPEERVPEPEGSLL